MKSPATRSNALAAGCRRREDRSRTRVPLASLMHCCGPNIYSVVDTMHSILLSQDVDDAEERNPHDIDEVPVVGHDDRGDSLLVGEGPG